MAMRERTDVLPFVTETAANEENAYDVGNESCIVAAHRANLRAGQRMLSPADRDEVARDLKALAVKLGLEQNA